MHKGMALVSIVIRTRNEEKYLGNLLSAIGKQTYRDHEIIVVDSGSTDRTVEIACKAGARVMEIDSNDFTFGYSLNVGCKVARGDYLVFVSAHVLPAEKDWLANLIAPFEDTKVGMVYGRQKGGQGSKFSEQKDFWRLFSKTAFNSKVPLYYANNANSAVRKNLWEKEPFDEYLFGLEDIDWARKVITKGFLIHYAPSAPVYHFHEESWAQVFNRYRREAIAAVRIGLAHPPQARLGIGWFVLRILGDLFGSRDWSPSRVKEIFLFRYYQWKGSCIGWRQGTHMKSVEKGDDIFFNLENHAVLITEKGKVEFSERPVPHLKPSEILIKVEYVGVCRTDIEVLEGTLGYYKDGAARYPIVPGHEFSGTIARVGSNNRFQEHFKVGEKVVGECILSRDPGDRREVGVINHDGAYATYVVIPGDHVHKIPEGLDLKSAALSEPLAVVLRALRRIEHRIIPGMSVAVVGTGPVGNLCAQALAGKGCKVAVFDKNAERLEALQGITERANTELSGLGAFDLIVEITGSRDVLERVLSASRFDATLLLLGFPYGNIPYNFEDVVGNEKVIVGSVGGDTPDFEAALALLPKLDLSRLTETVLPLQDYEKAWELHRVGKHLKILLKP